MSEGLIKLQEIGVQKISEQTHISKQHIQSLMQENFEALNKVQFLGFVSIIEREYELDLSALKEKGLKFYGEVESVKPASVFIERKSQKSSKGIYILVAFVIFIVAIYYNVDFAKIDIDVNATQVESVTQEIKTLVEANVSEVNSSVPETNQNVISDTEMNTSASLQSVSSDEKVQNTSNSLKIFTETKLWFGYIELNTDNKTQKVFSGELDLDSKKDWLLLFGHNNIEIELNGEKQKFEKSKNVQFLYQDGVLTQISLDEFKKLNKGNKW